MSSHDAVHASRRIRSHDRIERRLSRVVMALPSRLTLPPPISPRSRNRPLRDQIAIHVDESSCLRSERGPRPVGPNLSAMTSRPTKRIQNFSVARPFKAVELPAPARANQFDLSVSPASEGPRSAGNLRRKHSCFRDRIEARVLSRRNCSELRRCDIAGMLYLDNFVQTCLPRWRSVATLISPGSSDRWARDSFGPSLNVASDLPPRDSRQSFHPPRV